MKIKSKIINANAGSGKTYSIIKRIEEIIKDGNTPSSILCITFTKAGVAEMQERLEKDCSHLIQNHKPKIITFHALCQEIVTMFAYELKMPYEFENMESIDVDFLESIVKKVLSLPKIKGLILHFNLSYFEIESLCKSFLYEHYNITASELTRSQSLIDFFKIKKSLEEERAGIYKNVLQNIPMEMLEKLKGKTIVETLPEIIEIAKSNNFSQEIFEKYIDLIFSLRSKEVKEYKDLLTQQIERLKTLKQFEISKILNDCFAEISQIIESQKYDEAKYLFEDIVQKALSVLRNNELRDFALFKFGSAYKHILVDEAQDTNQDQWEIINYLMEENLATNMQEGSLFIVGDIKQTIYGFQGAEAGIMNDIRLKYQHILQEEFLTTSFRTTKPVLDVINKAFEIDEKQTHVSNFKNVGQVAIVRSTINSKDDKDLEIKQIANFVATKVKALLSQKLLHDKHHNKQIEFKDIVILARKRDEKTIDALREAFYANSIPIVFNEKIDYKKYNAILDFIALLKLCIIENDTQSAYGILASPIFGINEEELSQFFHKDNKIEDIFLQYPNLKDLIEKSKSVLLSEGLMVFFHEIYVQNKHKYSKQEAEILVKFIESTAKVNQFEFIKYIQNFEKAEQILINRPEPENSVTFTTAHSSKGLQYPIVFFLETTKPQNEKIDGKILIINGAIVWNSKKEERSEFVQSFIESEFEARNEEDFRLQYVVISRTEEKFFYIGNFYNTHPDEAGNLQNPNSMFHKLQKATTNDFICSAEDGLEIWEYIKENS